MINHDEISTTETISPISYVVSPTQQISTITITKTIQVSTTRMTQSASDSDDAVTICIPIVVVFGVIILLVLIVIIGILVWRKMRSKDDTPPYNKPVPRTTNVLVENDLYGLVSL